MMNSGRWALVLGLAALLLATSTHASMLRKRLDSRQNEEDEAPSSSSVSHPKQERSGLRRSQRSRQLFTNQRNPLMEDIDVDQPVEYMAASVTEILQRTLEESKASKNRVSLTDDLSGIQLQQAVDEDPCTLNGKVRFTSQRVKGLKHSFHTEDVHLVPGTEDYEEIIDERTGQTTGYKWNGVWKVVATIDAFQVDVTSQVDVDACGTPLDFTAFGGIAVNGTILEATIRVDGELSDDLSRGDLKIESAEVLSHAIEFDSVYEMGGLSRHLPLNYEGELNSLVEYLIKKKLSRPVLEASTSYLR